MKEIAKANLAQKDYPMANHFQVANLQNQRFKKLIEDFEGLLDRFLIELKSELSDDELLDLFMRRCVAHNLLSTEDVETLKTLKWHNVVTSKDLPGSASNSSC